MINFGTDNPRLIAKVWWQSPDGIFLDGDMIDCGNRELEHMQTDTLFLK